MSVVCVYRTVHIRQAGMSRRVITQLSPVVDRFAPEEVEDERSLDTASEPAHTEPQPSLNALLQTHNKPKRAHGFRRPGK